MKYMSNKEIFICIMLGLGIGFAAYVLPFFWSRAEEIDHMLSYFIFSLRFLDPLVFWVVVPLVKVFKRKKQQ